MHELQPLAERLLRRQVFEGVAVDVQTPDPRQRRQGRQAREAHDPAGVAGHEALAEAQHAPDAAPDRSLPLAPPRTPKDEQGWRDQEQGRVGDHAAKRGRDPQVADRGQLGAQEGQEAGRGGQRGPQAGPPGLAQGPGAGGLGRAALAAEAFVGGHEVHRVRDPHADHERQEDPADLAEGDPAQPAQPEGHEEGQHDEDEGRARGYGVPKEEQEGHEGDR